MKAILSSILITAVVSVAVSVISDALLAAEWKTQSKVIDPGELFIIPELGSVILSKGDAIVVDLAGPSENRPEAYRKIELKEGDHIIMLNGSRVNSIKDLEAQYAVISPEELVKIGVKRDGRMMIVSFPKADPRSLPQRRMIVSSEGGAGDVSVIGASPDQVVDIESRDAAVIAEVGLIIGPIDGKLSINSILPMAADVEGLEDVKVGDIVDQVNGVHFQKPQDLADYWNEFKVGDEIVLTLIRDGKTHTVKFKQPESKNDTPMIIRTKPRND